MDSVSVRKKEYIYWAHLSSFLLKTETDSVIVNVVI
jgi:hypothetical protein